MAIDPRVLKRYNQILMYKLAKYTGPDLMDKKEKKQKNH
jgi:hypothetical protein